MSSGLDKTTLGDLRKMYDRVEALYREATAKLEEARAAHREYRTAVNKVLGVHEILKESEDENSTNR